jgi:hypothetical protein
MNGTISITIFVQEDNKPKYLEKLVDDGEKVNIRVKAKILEPKYITIGGGVKERQKEVVDCAIVRSVNYHMTKSFDKFPVNIIVIGD